MATPGTVQAFPAPLVPLIQEGWLDREVKTGLQSVLAYRYQCDKEDIPNKIGETVTKTRYGRKAPLKTPLTPNGLTGALDGGVTATSPQIEQYGFTMAKWGDATDLNLLEVKVGIGNQFLLNGKNNGIQASQTLDAIARRRLFGAYLGGNSRAIDKVHTAVKVWVDDIRGFQFVLKNGKLTAVSASNFLTVKEYPTATSGGLTQTLKVTDAVVDEDVISTVEDGVAGYLTIDNAGGSIAPITGDTLVAVNAPRIIRPNGKRNTAQIQGQDTLTLAVIEDAVAHLRANAIPTFEDGTYHLVLDDISMRQLLDDQNFKIAHQGQIDSEAYRTGKLTRFMGVTYITTTEAYVQEAGEFNDGTAGGDVGQRIRRPILMGAGSLIQGNFQGLRDFANQAQPPQSAVLMEMAEDIAMITRTPLDRFGELISQGWLWVGDFCVPSDATATTEIIKTAYGPALYKRCVVIEHAG